MALLLFSMASLASTDAAKQSFWADKKVNERINSAGPNFRVGEIQVIFLKESCGYLGCITDYLVGVPLLNETASLKSSSVLAKVQLTGDSPMLVQVLPEYSSSIVTE